MTEFFNYFRTYFRDLSARLFFACMTYAALLVFCNYYFQLEPVILSGIPDAFAKFLAFFVLYVIAFAVPYVFIGLMVDKSLFRRKMLWITIVCAAAIFAIKVNASWVSGFIYSHYSDDSGRFLAVISNLPSRLLILLLCLYAVWKFGKYPSPFFGATLKGVKWKPYFLMLLIMIPLIAWASTQADFLRTYPKLKAIYFLGDHLQVWHSLLYEFAYGLDFISIELFFRGFLILGFVRFAGRNAILPMAVFYCSIHFGKPLMECVSSFFGGIILGVVVYETRSIAGGLVVHLGIAWMMEIGGYLGSLK